MAKYGFTTSIPYDGNHYDVTGLEYCEWEDALEKAEDSEAGRLWATYDVLIGHGYFVKAPHLPRPKVGDAGDDIKEDESDEGVRDERPGFRDVTADNRISGNSREPEWTQSKILAERDKLLKEKERIIALKEEALEKKIDAVKTKQAKSITFYNDDGTPYTRSDWSMAILGFGFVMFFFTVLIIAIFRF